MERKKFGTTFQYISFRLGKYWDPGKRKYVIEYAYKFSLKNWMHSSKKTQKIRNYFT